MVKVFRWLSGISIAFFAALVLCIIILSHYFSNLPKYKANIENWLAAHLEESVKIDGLTTHWQGFKPIISIDNLNVQDKNQHTLLQIEQLQLSINVLASLWTWKIQPGDLLVNGTHLELKEAKNGIVYINDIPTLTADIKNPNSEKLKMLGEWFLSKGKKELKNVRVTWYSLNGKTIPIKELKLQGDSSIWNHTYQVNAKMDDAATLQLHANVFGSIFLEQMLYTHLNFNSHHLPIATLLAGFVEHPLQFLSGYADIEGKLSWLPRAKINFFGNLNAHNVILKKQNSLYDLKTLSSQFSLNRSRNSWGFSFSELFLNLNNKVVPIHQGKFKYIFNQQQPKQIFQIDVLPVSDVLKIIYEQDFLPKKIAENIKQLNPIGTIANLVISHKGNTLDFSHYNDFTVSANLKKININPWEKFPGIKNLTGKLAILPEHGHLYVNSKNVVFEYLSLFRWPIPIEKVIANVDWKKINDVWEVNLNRNSSIQTKEGSAKGGMKLLIPVNGGSPIIQTKMEFDIRNSANAKIYYPAGIMSKRLVNWLDNAIKGGAFSKGIFVLNGRLKDFPFDHNNGKFLVSSQINQGKLHYFSDLPDAEQIQGNLLFKNRSMLITANKASVLRAAVNASTAEIKDLKHSILNLKVNLITAPQQTIKINEAIFKRINSPLATDLFLNGAMNVGFNLWLPLDINIKDRFKLSGQANLQNLAVYSENRLIDFKHLTGNLLAHENVIETQKITGDLYNNPFNLNIHTLAQNGILHTLVKWQGVLNSKELQQRFQTEWLNKIEGNTNINGSFDVFENGGNIAATAEVNSDLTGLTINLPSPFAKENSISQPTIIKTAYEKKQLKVNFTSGNFLGHLAYRILPNTMQFDRGVIAFGDVLPKSPEEGLLITGHIPKLDWTLWHDLLKTKNEEQKFTFLHFPAQINLSIDKLFTNNLNMNQLSLQATTKNHDLVIDVNSSMVAGKINMPFDFPNHPLQAQLQRLEWNVSENDNQLNPSDIPPMELEINNLRYKNKDIKNIKLKVQPEGKNLLIRELKIADPLFQMQSSGEWQNRNQKQTSHIQGQLDINNMGALLNHWKLTDNVVLGHGSIKFNLAWNDAINSPEMKSMQGNVNLQFTKGRIIHLSQQAQVGIGIGRVLNLLSLQTIPRRLLLDFSDLTSNGFNFDTLGGNFELSKGNAFTKDAFLEGTEAKVRVNGKIGLSEKDYNLTLKIFPNVTSSLPLVATIAAGPIAGVATWLADKIFSHQVKKMTEIHYNVTGSWSQPNMVKLPEKKSEI